MNANLLIDITSVSLLRGFGGFGAIPRLRSPGRERLRSRLRESRWDWGICGDSPKKIRTFWGLLAYCPGRRVCAGRQVLLLSLKFYF